MAGAQSGHIIARDEWRKYGSVVPACLLGMTLVAMHGYSLGVVLEPLEREFGWSRSEIAAGPMVTSIFTLLFAPVGGRAVDRFGPRRVALLGVPAFALAIAAISLAGPNILSWLALYALLAIALLLVFPTVWTAAIASRFDSNRGLALAIALSGTGITSALVPSGAAWLLEHYGWRGVYVGLGAASMLVVYPFVLLLFDRGEPRIKPHISAQPGLAADGLKQLARSRKFLTLSLAGFIYAIAVTGIGINAVPILMEEGFDLARAARLAGLIGIATIFGRVMGGFLLDRIDGRYVAAGCCLAAIGSAMLLLATDQSALAAAASCLLLGLAAGGEYDACAYLTTRHFLHRQFGLVFSVVGGLSGFGSGISPLLANGIYDLTGHYDTMLWAIVPIFAVAIILFLSLGAYPDHQALERGDDRIANVPADPAKA